MLNHFWGTRAATLAALAVLSIAAVTPAHAQFGRRLKDAVKRTAEDKAIEKTTEKESAAIDSLTASKKADSAATAAKAPAPADSTPAAGASPTAAASTSPSDKKVWANYDFVPGQRTIFFTDFTEDEVGNFPQRLDFKSGQMEVVEFEGGQRAIKAS